jgi:hypothetical protein
MTHPAGQLLSHDSGCAKGYTRTPLTHPDKKADNNISRGLLGNGAAGAKMKGSKVFVVLMALWFILVSPGMTQASFDLLLPEESVFLEDAIPLEFKDKGGQKISFDIRDDIRRGQEFLRDKIAGCSLVKEEKRVTFSDKKGRKRGKRLSEKVIKPNFILAVQDFEERKISQVRITSDGCVTNGFEVTKSRTNGVGSRFEVTYPENTAVLALRTTVRSGKNSFKEVVYTAYSPEIDTPQVRRDGLDYLMQQIDLAHKDLAARNVKLVGFDGLEADTMPAEVSLVLSIIEHIDPVRFMNCQEGKELALVHEVLTIVGANTTDAYAYSKSPAGARGLFQLIPDTYRRLRAKYPKAGLKEDFVSGCIDHVNAAKASLLLFNSDLADLPREQLSAMKQNGRAMGKYLAAAYNCGSGKVQKSARVCGDKWTCRLPEETKIYLKKFDVVWDLRETLAR